MVNWHTIWTSIATPAAVAVLVTLVAGYSLTPRLAVRQQRFLAVDSGQRELVSHLVTAGIAAAAVRQHLDGDEVDSAVIETFRAEQRRHYDRMRQTCIHMFDQVGTYAAAYSGRWRDQVLHLASVLYGVVMSQRSHRRQAELVSDLARLAAGVFERGHWWQIPGKVRAWLELGQLIEEVSSPKGSTSQIGDGPPRPVPGPASGCA